jgi:hypothetical protein
VEARDHSHWYGVRVAVSAAGPDDSGLCAGRLILDESRSIVTERCPCPACSCADILRAKTPGQAGQRLAPELLRLSPCAHISAHRRGSSRHRISYRIGSTHRRRFSPSPEFGL